MRWKVITNPKSLLPGLVLLLIIIGQINYLPARLDYLHQLAVFARAEPEEAARLAYQPASYNLLVWIEQHTAPDTTLLLLTASPRTYGDPAYVLYHRALYHLYPRPVWWAAPVPANHYPVWWLSTDLTETNILTLAEEHGATVVLADGFTRPPVSGHLIAFDDDTHLVFLNGSGQILSSGRQHLGSDGWWSAICGLLLSLGAMLSIWLWGDVLYRLTLRHLTGSWQLRLAVGWLLGCGITSLAAFLLLWLGLSLTPSVIGLSLLGCFLWLYLHRTTLCLPHFPSITLSPCHLITLSPLLFILLALQIALVAFAAWASPPTDWDAWVNWGSKANAIFIDQTISANIYHHPARLPTNMDYPLMLPLVEAWFYTWLGQIYEPVINSISVLFYLALLLLFYHASRLLVSPLPALGFTMFLATIPRLERPAHSGLADIPLAALVLLSFLLLFEWQRHFAHPSSNLPTLPTGQGAHRARKAQSPRLLASLALATGLLPWLKNEGWIWWGLMMVSLLVSLGWQVKRKYYSPQQAAFSFLISYFLPALAIPLLWQIFLTLFGTFRFTFLPLTLATFWTNLPRLPVIAVNIFSRMFNPYWNFVWLWVGFVLIIRRQRCLAAPLGVVIIPILVYLLFGCATYLFSRFEPFLAHLNNSAERLMLQAAPVALWWLVGQCVSIGWIKSNK